MSNRPFAALTLAATLVGAGAIAAPSEPGETLLLQQPDIDARHIVFIYDDDVWIEERDGGRVRRLTSAPGTESAPHLSPDGSTVTFSGNYDGNVDVYAIPVTGGVPARLTWHGGPDIVQGFLPDGRVMFSSYRDLHTDRMIRLYAVPLAGTTPERLPVPDGDDAQVSPDGSWIAYATMSPAYRNVLPQAKNYRGGDASRVWIMSLRDYGVSEIPQPAGRCNDLNPVWLDGRVYFVSDRAGEFNLFRFDPQTQEVRQLSDYDDFPVLNLNEGGGKLVYEHAGRLYTFNPEAETSQRLRIAVNAELLHSRPQYVSDPSYVRAVSISPDAARIALEYRGEIVMLPVDGGPVRNLTRSPGANDRAPSWSPDGEQIAWFSDQSGEYALYLQAANGSNPARRIELRGAGFYADLKWSPNGRFVSFRDNSLSLFVLDVSSGNLRWVSQEPVYGPSIVPEHHWAPDSQWLAYSVGDRNMLRAVYLYSVAEQRSVRLTSTLIDASEPIFDPKGDYLYLAVSIDAGPVRDWFTQSRSGLSITRTLYAVPLPADLGSRAGDIDPESLTDRALAFPATTGSIRNMQSGRSREILYESGASDSPGRLVRLIVDPLSPAASRPQTLAEGVGEYIVGGDGSAIFYRAGSAWWSAPLGAGIESTAKQLPLDAVSVRIEPRAEWRQIAREGWRLQRDYFYASNFHGADWNAIWKKYEPLLDHAVTRSDVARIQAWMSSELAVSHGYVLRSDPLEQPRQVSVGLLGADFTIDQGRYRFAKIYGSHWTPDIAAPLKGPGSQAAEGEFLLSVEGTDIRATDDLYRHFQNTAGRPVAITVGPRADGRDSRELTVMPVSDDTLLRRIDWIESNIHKVDAATRGRVAYVYVPDTSARGMALFKRYFYPQSHKEAIIVDARFNGGGSSGDYYIDMLRRAEVGEFSTRYGDDQRVPRAAILGPKVLLVNEMTRSGGDLFAYAFRKLKLGPLIGTTTTGALVGNLGVPELMDGSVVTAPNFGFWTPEQGWAVENAGVSPDIEVQQRPSAVNAGHDPQLEKAIATILHLLEPAPRDSARPAYPRRVRD